MPITYKQPNTGLADLVKTMVSAPALVSQGRAQANDLAMERRRAAAELQESIANASKTNLESSRLATQDQLRAGLGQDLNVMGAYNEGRPMPVPPPAAGSATNPLDADINAALRGNQDLFTSSEVPGPDQYHDALGNVLAAYGGNAQQVTEGMLNAQTAGLRTDAAGQAQDNLGGRELIAALNSIAAGNQVQAPFSQTGGMVLNEFTGGLDESSGTAQAGIAADQALADQRRTNESLTPQEKQYQALVDWNEARVAAGMPPVPDERLRAAAAGAIDTRQDAMGLNLLQYNPVTGEPHGTISPKEGFQPYAAPSPEEDQGGEGLTSMLLNAMKGYAGLDGGGEQEPVQDPNAQAPPQRPVTANDPVIAQAINAIGQGADPAAVLRRLDGMGYDPQQVAALIAQQQEQ